MEYQIAVSTKHGCHVMQNNKGIPFVFDAESAERWIKFIEFEGGKAKASAVAPREWSEIAIMDGITELNVIGAI